ncbi:hypothetical protein CRYUN_Cryun38cG0063100 [Craigia yunnanensis]
MERASEKERISEREMGGDRKERQPGRDDTNSKSSRGRHERSVSPSDRHHRNRHRSRSPASNSTARDKCLIIGCFVFLSRDDQDDSVAKMKAAEEALETKQKQKPTFELSGKLAAETNRVREVNDRSTKHGTYSPDFWQVEKEQPDADGTLTKQVRTIPLNLNDIMNFLRKTPLNFVIAAKSMSYCTRTLPNDSEILTSKECVSMKLKVTMANNKDLFMELPQCLLHIIISFLPFKEAARTSILSKLWLNLWCSTRNIEFEESFFVNPEESDATKVMKRKVFIDFVQQWIGNYCEPCVDKFALAFSKPGQFVADIENFISFALAKTVGGLSLDFSDPTWMEDDTKNHEPLFDLPSHVYEHGVLESLKLFSCKIDRSALKNFGLLKDLSLGWMELDEKSIKALLQYCPLLENLSLTKCWNIEHFILSEPSLLLRKLVIDKCSFHEPGWIYLEIAPRLRFFKYSGRVASFDLDYLCCLEEADLDFGLESSFRDVGDLLYKLLLDLFSVTILTVCSFMLQVIPNSEEPQSTEFPLNVRHLTLKTALHSHEFYGITFFLNSCPLLETLTIELCPARVFPDYEPPFEFSPVDFWTKNLIVYKCIHHTLKMVEVKGFKGTLNEFMVLQYLICLGRAMERLNLSISKETDDNGGNVELYRARAQMLLQLKKASKKLQISIY